MEIKTFKHVVCMYVILVYLHSDVCIYSATIQISEMDLIAVSSIIEKNFVTRETYNMDRPRQRRS